MLTPLISDTRLVLFTCPVCDSDEVTSEPLTEALNGLYRSLFMAGGVVGRTDTRPLTVSATS
jgi:hypothetical protein